MEKQNIKYEAKENEFRGNPIIEIGYKNDNEQYIRIISFGYRKAQAIINNIDGIKAFVEKTEKQKQQKQQQTTKKKTKKRSKGKVDLKKMSKEEISEFIRSLL
jgi:alpha-galactosidase/6-phospho-beta-glucosidase family protein